MSARFVQITALVEQFYKHIIKIKAYYMKDYGLKASHAMCLFYIGNHQQGLTASELCTLCMEDKAGISKALSELKANGVIAADPENGSKAYRLKYCVTEKGREIHNQISQHICDAVNACKCDFTEEESNFFYSSLESIVNSVVKYHDQLKTKEIAKGDKV